VRRNNTLSSESNIEALAAGNARLLSTFPNRWAPQENPAAASADAGSVQDTSSDNARKSEHREFDVLIRAW